MKNLVKVVLLLFVIVCAVIEVRGQALKIGDKVPNLYLANLYRHSKRNGNLITEFGGKPIILDFWFSGCSTCFQEMPRLDSLQKRYLKDLSILMVTFNTKEQAIKSLNKAIIKDVKLPTVVADTALRKLFPHLSEPHEVWIDANGIVAAITSNVEITEANIQKLIRGESLNLPVKRDSPDMGVGLGYQPFITIDDNFNKSNSLIEYSFFGGFNPVMLGFSQDLLPNFDGVKKDLLRIKCGNVGIKQLYQKVYNRKFFDNQFFFEGSLKAFITPDFENKKNIYCYDFITSDTVRARVLKKIQKDVDNRLGISSIFKKQLAKCYIIKKSPSFNADKLNPSLGKPQILSDNKFYRTKNLKWKMVVDNFFNDDLELPYEVIDEVNLLGSVDFEFPKKWESLEIANKNLAKYGLRITEEDRERDVLSLTRRDDFFDNSL